MTVHTYTRANLGLAVPTRHPQLNMELRRWLKPEDHQGQDGNPNKDLVAERTTQPVREGRSG